jgi:DNA-directed RNA polymerase sigma subunit (sigma70/sigma32)
MRMVRSEERQRLQGWISSANRRTRELIDMIREGRSLSETGRRLGVTRERARQMRQRLLHDLRRKLEAEATTGGGMGSLPTKR